MSQSSQDEIGTLIVVVLKARNLNDKHKFRKQDAYAKVLLNGTEKQTKVEIKGGQHPLWDEEFRFPIFKSTAKKNRTLEVSCWAKEPRTDDILGTGTVDISETLQNGEFDDWVPLSIDGVTRGDVYLEMTYYANGPPPPSVIPTIAPPKDQPVAYYSPGKNALLVAQGANLMRRPSKLSPADRLSRPAISIPETIPSSPNQHHRFNTLPPVPDDRIQASNPVHAAQPVPSLLRPGAVPTRPRPIRDPSPVRPGQEFSNASPGTSPGRTSNPYLTGAAGSNRPGGVGQHHRTPSNPAASNPYLTGGTNTPPVTYPLDGSPAPASIQNNNQPYATNYPPPSHTPGTQYPPPSHTPLPQYPPQTHTPAPPPGAVPLLWSSSDSGSHPVVPPPAGGFAFPTPGIPGAYPATPTPHPPYHSNSYDHSAPRPYGHNRQSSDPRDDPSLRNRYQTPLPLPPGVRHQSPDPQSPHQRPHSQSPRRGRDDPLPPLPAPPRAPSPPRQESPSSLTAADRQRLEELKWLEAEAKRRKEQEERDLALALQLDKELNL
ncbi:hypothetical protein CC1G_07069 [Coprinopsis cinerea okayama7|uniref:C2 domain-containing protein n=1 Tax=Coprinopsis cinerea (strain Okayama-7 / 130 / ATCC MYA-4618 / FGSC 9003) TaxID=240176 RepID=A8NUC3_COPC7|nr:hypothetical protein CC1G_07069 [Coprinopsis cinerea okayama7\|eukprot:XP_001836422.2 hypothetical protein CC1G_07069 [Coprinopsis cinerea okayama7\